MTHNLLLKIKFDAILFFSLLMAFCENTNKFFLHNYISENEKSAYNLEQSNCLTQAKATTRIGRKAGEFI